MTVVTLLSFPSSGMDRHRAVYLCLSPSAVSVSVSVSCTFPCLLCVFSVSTVYVVDEVVHGARRSTFYVIHSLIIAVPKRH